MKFIAVVIILLLCVAPLGNANPRKVTNLPSGLNMRGIQEAQSESQ